MKRLIYLAFIMAMLSFLVFPPVVQARDSTRAPFDCLENNEQTYVTTVRSLINTTKDRIDIAKIDLPSFFMEQYSVWYARIAGEINAVNSAIKELKKVQALENFTGFYYQCQALGEVSLGEEIGWQLLAEDLAIKAQGVAGLEGLLTAVEKNLNSLSSGLDKRIEQIAQEVQRAEEGFAKWLESCDSRPARSY